MRHMVGLGHEGVAGYKLQDWDSTPVRSVDFSLCNYVQIGSGTRKTTHSKEQKRPTHEVHPSRMCKRKTDLPDTSPRFRAKAKL
jgi:hypothetical protein